MLGFVSQFEGDKENQQDLSFDNHSNVLKFEYGKPPALNFDVSGFINVIQDGQAEASCKILIFKKVFTIILQISYLNVVQFKLNSSPLV